MAKVRSKDTGPELRVRKALHKAGYRYRLHRKDLPGRPDIFLPQHKMAVFVHGCFWHGHEGCNRARLPSTSVDFWRAKISKNKERDQRVISELEAQGIGVLVFWGCQLKDDAAIADRLAAAIADLR